MGQGGDDFLPRQRTDNRQYTTSDQRGGMGRYVLGGQKTGQKLVVELGVAQREPEDVRRAVDRNGAGQHWRVGEGTAVTGARGGRGGEGTAVTGARDGRGGEGTAVTGARDGRGGEGTAVRGASGDGDSLLGGRAGRGQRGERWILLGVDGQRSRIPQQIPDSEC